MCYTSAGRVSREAPVLVTEFEKNEYLLGGAGNVVMNLLTLGALPLPVGFIGKDAAGIVLLELLRKNRISTDYLVKIDRFSHAVEKPDPVRRRQHQETADPAHRYPAPGCHQRTVVRKSLPRRSLPCMRDCDLLILSDYLGKTVTPGIFKSAQESVPRLKPAPWIHGTISWIFPA